ncbi:hypothetical protein EV182_004483 [Spiromyces aspiralis]|uniref:Uncharacterized protein n=1 Tax=Spiromyces aspiralis TaxID=68401 RepID=A0ACC1HEM2_9FUNG|nr:hypothetical protein EV182_004483 [Spiromyces aspiralis]
MPPKRTKASGQGQTPPRTTLVSASRGRQKRLDSYFVRVERPPRPLRGRADAAEHPCVETGYLSGQEPVVIVPKLEISSSIYVDLTCDSNTSLSSVEGRPPGAQCRHGDASDDARIASAGTAAGEGPRAMIPVYESDQPVVAMSAAEGGVRSGAKVRLLDTSCLGQRKEEERPELG